MDNIFSGIEFINKDGIKQYNILINGCWRCISSNKTFEVRNPANNELIALVPNCDINDVNYAIESAKNSPNLNILSPIKRLDIMENARQLIIENENFLSEIITKESGKPISVSKGEVLATQERFRLTMQEINVLQGEYLPGDLVSDTENKFAIVIRKPIGVVATISPFNYPLFIAASKIIPAILAGNSVVAKPSSDTPLSLIYLVRILELAGMPKGTINIITGCGGEIGDAIIQSPLISAISFTGSTKVGENITKKCGIKKLHLELGGKASAIVLKDADLENAVKQICKGSFRNSGQRCDAISRVLVDKSIKKDFIKKVLIEAEKYITGDPMDPKTQIGAIINEKALKHINSLVIDALNKGATILRGGTYNDLFYDATIIDNVNLDMDIAWEEIFGPVMPIIEVNDYEEAVKISNRSEYGLDSCVFTENINLGIKISKMLDDGSVTINAM
ncbi:MAG TPA: aldehyde dehydrogenase family protein, partial [Spirochaetota bacterium]|nr:aldehyde dehydrogenase family protein [Spirochaetota bacterium]